MRNYKNWLFILVGFGFVSCSPKFYSPNTQNVPLLTQKDETNLTLSGNGNRVEFQGAYGITENIGLVANGGLFIPTDQNNGNGGSGQSFEFGGGYFTPIQDKWVFETYGILGFGSFENHLPSTQSSHPQTKGDISAQILRVGIQPNFGYKTPYFSVGVSSRIVNLSYSQIEGDLIFANVDQVQLLKDNSSNFLIEPALTVRGGFEKFKLQLQYGYSANLSNSDFKQDNVYFTFGFNFNFK